MFERFTDRARRVVVLAQEEARKLNHNYIGTEHLLLGLIRESEGVAAKALESLGISLDAVRQQVREIIGQGQQPPSGHIPFTKRAKKALELSTRESMQFGHNYIGTEHILLGLLREGDGVAAQVLVKLGADLNLVRQQVIQLLHGSGKRAGTRLPDDALARIDALDHPIAWRRSNAGQACDLTWASWSRRSRRRAGRRKPRSTGRISRPPPRRATRRRSSSPPGPTGRRSGPRPLLAARRWPANWAG
jgi:Clp amino terminal domain, pathogenicity island component